MRQFNVKVEAIQVTRPYVNITHAIPRARQIKKGNGRSLAYFIIPITKDANPDPTTGFARAYEGDWIVFLPSGERIVVTDEHFRQHYMEVVSA